MRDLQSEIRTKPRQGGIKLATGPIHWYKSKVDWWLAPLLAIPPVASLSVTVSALKTGNPVELAWGLGSMLLVAGIYFGLIFPLRYGISNDQLIVRFGMCRQHVPLKDIVEVRPTRNPLSSPALSLDRLQIQFGAGIFNTVMISPAEREQFLSELAQNAGLYAEGDRLVKELAHTEP